MHASVRRYSMGAGSIDSLMHRVDEEFAPALSQEPGFVCYFALDTGDATVETISIFHDKASADRSNELAADYVRENLGEFEFMRTAVTAGEVLVSRTTPEALDDAHRWRTGRARLRSWLGRDVSEGPVLVIGATGRTGRLIVERLVERHVPVRALVRDPAKGREVLPPEVLQFAGDVRRSETLAEPMTGVRAVINAICGSTEHDNSAEMVDYFGTRNLVEQAAATDVDLVVFVSTIYASRPAHYQDVEPTSLGWKAKAEEIIRGSRTPYCIIRSGWLTDGRGGEPLALSQGDTAEGRISRTDLADVCTQLLFLPDARGKTFEVVTARAGPASSLASAVASLVADSTLQSRTAVSAVSPFA
jgi:uncharacterized protein YbjT (DUF2867 family)